MSYISGFLLAVPKAKKEAYAKFAEDTWPMFAEYGALSLRENWGVDTPDGKLTSFPMAVKKQDDEVVVFSWMEWPDKAAADAGWQKMMQDPRMEVFNDLPFDGARMMFGGFELLVERRA